MSEEEFNESLDLFRENNLTKYGIDELYGEIVDREIERKRLKSQLQQKENKEKEIREYIEQLLEYKKDKKVSLEYIERIIDIINQDKRY